MQWVPFATRCLASGVMVLFVTAWAATRADEPPAAGDKQQAAAAVTEKGDEAHEGSLFLRIQRNEQGEPVSMDTSVTTYAPAGDDRPGLTVDLIGVVHVGDKDYYDGLNERFTRYDAVLFELVAPEGTKIEPDTPRRSAHPISMLQRGMQTVLELEFQLDQIDYSKENMIHADMTPEEFATSMKDRGESFLQMFFRLMSQSMAMQQKNAKKYNDFQLLYSLFSKNRALNLKRIMAEQFEDMESQLAVLSGPSGSTIITERNKKAFEVLDREINAGKKRVAVFYGAGHLPDMEQRLIDDFKMKRVGHEWLPAWTMEAEPAQQPAGRDASDTEAEAGPVKKCA